MARRDGDRGRDRLPIDGNPNEGPNEAPQESTFGNDRRAPILPERQTRTPGTRIEKEAQEDPSPDDMAPQQPSLLKDVESVAGEPAIKGASIADGPSVNSGNSAPPLGPSNLFGRSARAGAAATTAIPASTAEKYEKERQEFFLPVTGFAWFYDEEIQIIDHPVFQRLGKVNQLGQTNLVWRGATHKRMEHSLGAVPVVQRMIDAIAYNNRKGEQRNRPVGKCLEREEVRFVRLGVLLHDIGHLAAGHTIEDELGLLGRHDSTARLRKLFVSDKWRDSHNRTLGTLIDELYGDYRPRSLNHIPASTIVLLLIRKAFEAECDCGSEEAILPAADDGGTLPLAPRGEAGARATTSPTAIEDPYGEELKELQASCSLRYQVCRDLIGNTICADLLDYLHRDWYHLGKPRPFDERLLHYMEIHTRRSTPKESSSADSVVISLGDRPKLRTDAISAILELLEWRYQLIESVLFHRTKLIAAGMLDRALYELWGGDMNQDELEDMLLPLSDEGVLLKAEEDAQAILRKRSKGSPETMTARARVALNLIQAIEQRCLHKVLLTRFYDDLPADVRHSVRSTYGREGKTLKGDNDAAHMRNQTLNLLETDFKLEPGSLIMYCPTESSMNHKIAGVKIAVGSEIKPFEEYERANTNALSGGHLGAQLQRYTRLWRIIFAIDPRRNENRPEALTVILRYAIEKLVLGVLNDGETVRDYAIRIAEELTKVEGSPWQGRALKTEVKVEAAFSNAESAIRYPTGAPSLASLLSQ